MLLAGLASLVLSIVVLASPKYQWYPYHDEPNQYYPKDNGKMWYEFHRYDHAYTVGTIGNGIMVGGWALLFSAFLDYDQRVDI